MVFFFNFQENSGKFFTLIKILIKKYEGVEIPNIILKDIVSVGNTTQEYFGKNLRKIFTTSV